MNTDSNSNPIPRYYKWYMLIFLWFAFFLNQGDRQLFNNVLPLIEAPIHADSEAQSDAEGVSSPNAPAKAETVAQSDAEGIPPTDAPAKAETVAQSDAEGVPPADALATTEPVVKSDAEGVPPADALAMAETVAQSDAEGVSSTEKPLEGGLGFDKVTLGKVATWFTIFYGIFVPFAGFAGDKIRKKMVVFLSLMVFSFGTLATGIVPNSEWISNHLPGGSFLWLEASTISLLLLIAVRSIATGIGEAFYYPAANSLIALYHDKTRATAMAVHQTANYTGVVFGGTFSAWIGFTYGWRTAFCFFGIIGIVWATIIYFLFRNDKADGQLMAQEKAAREPKPETQPIHVEGEISTFDACMAVLSRPTFYFLSLAFAGMCFVNVGFLTWMPTYLKEHFGVSGTVAGFNATFWHHLLAYMSVFLAAGVSDYLASKVRNIRMQTEFWGLLLGAPFIYWMGATENLILVYVALAGFGFFRGIYDSNLVASLFDVIEPKYRSTATGLMFAIAFVLGSFSPWILAILEKQYKGDFGPGLSMLAWVYVGSALLVLISMVFFYNRDRSEAEKNLE